MGGGSGGIGEGHNQPGLGRTVHEGVESGRSQGGTRSRRGNVETQSSARKEAHGNIEGGSHVGEALSDIMGMSDGDGADGGSSGQRAGGTGRHCLI